MPGRWTLWIFLSTFLPASAVLAIHAAIGSFNRYITDDFCSDFFAQRLGLLRSVWFWYRTWSGRYAVSFYDALLPLIGRSGLPYVVLGVLLIWLALLITAIAAGWPGRAALRERLIPAVSLGTAVIFVTLLISPNVPQSLYWWNGMRTYVSPLLPATLYFSLFHFFKTKRYKWPWLATWLGISFALAFMAGGSNEAFMAVQVVFFSVLILYGLLARKFQQDNQAWLFLLAGLLGALTGLVVMFLAPGNAERQAFFPESPGIFKILAISLNGYAVFLLDIIKAPEKAAGLLAVLGAAAWFGRQSRTGTVPAGRWAAALSLLAGLVLAYGCFPSAAFAMSDVPPARSLLIPAYFIVIGVLLCGFFLGVEWGGFTPGPGKPVIIAFCAGLTVLMLFSAWVNGAELLKSMHKYSDYAVVWDQAEALILEAKEAGQKEVIIPVVTNWAGLDNPNDNPKFWVNYCISQFYDISVLAIDQK